MSENEFNSEENHAGSIIQSHYDGQSGAGYLKFCNCPNGKTEDLMDKTVHTMLYDWDKAGSHVIGLEILNFPIGGLMKGPLSGDLALTELSEPQKVAVLSKFLQ